MLYQVCKHFKTTLWLMEHNQYFSLENKVSNMCKRSEIISMLFGIWNMNIENLNDIYLTVC